MLRSEAAGSAVNKQIETRSSTLHVRQRRNEITQSGRNTYADRHASFTVARCLLSLAVFLLGVAVCMYPHIAQRVNNDAATRLVAEVNDPSTTGAAASEDEQPAEQAAAINDQDIFGSIYIPKLDLELPIFIGSTSENLSRGIAHLEGTSLPTGGSSTHAVLAGHNGSITNEWFTHIDELAQGDCFYIRTQTFELKYQVVETKIIAPTETSELLIVRDKDLVTLLTCTDSGADRLIVTGERVADLD